MSYVDLLALAASDSDADRGGGHLDASADGNLELPSDVLHITLHYGNVCDVPSFASTCRHWNSALLSADASLWRRHLMRHHVALSKFSDKVSAVIGSGDDDEPSSTRPTTGWWKELFKRALFLKRASLHLRSAGLDRREVVGELEINVCTSSGNAKRCFDRIDASGVLRLGLDELGLDLPPAGQTVELGVWVGKFLALPGDRDDLFRGSYKIGAFEQSKSCNYRWKDVPISVDGEQVHVIVTTVGTLQRKGNAGFNLEVHFAIECGDERYDDLSKFEIRSLLQNGNKHRVPLHMLTDKEKNDRMRLLSNRHKADVRARVRAARKAARTLPPPLSQQDYPLAAAAAIAAPVQNSHQDAAVIAAAAAAIAAPNQNAHQDAAVLTAAADEGGDA